MKLFSPLLTILFAAAIAGVDRAPDALAARLEIEGKFVEKLAIENNKGVLRVIENPGPSWSLPADRYRVREVHLRGGWSYTAGEPDGFSVTTEQPCRLDVGAPLTPNVKVRRSFRRLELDFELLDAGGRNYDRPQRADLATFAIYSGDRKIGSGVFEYG